jgi:hypothetical protein
MDLCNWFKKKALFTFMLGGYLYLFIFFLFFYAEKSGERKNRNGLEM